MQLLNSAGLLAVLTFGSVVSSLPSAVTEAKSVFDPDVTYEEHIKQFKGSFEKPESVDLTPLAPLEPAEALDKRYVSSTCGPEFYLWDRVQEAHQLCDAAIRALENPNDYQAGRFIRYFSSAYWNPTVRGILRTRYLQIKDEFSAASLNMVCTWEDAGNTYAITAYVPGRPDLGATITLYSLFWHAPDPNQCGDNNASKATVLVHEGSHAAWQSADHGPDPAFDAYLIMWYAASEFGNCPY
ncbi:hypothetical protein DL95DRAFT_464571 [Leptodontidium sp. 2 PMI_412]|nr:hypothetical protein DL95DRAFT_464571 [Leptodontidium sp. 2 PMI_412]